MGGKYKVTYDILRTKPGYIAAEAFGTDNVLVDFRLSWGTNEVDCTSSPRFSGRVPRRT